MIQDPYSQHTLIIKQPLVFSLPGRNGTDTTLQFYLPVFYDLYFLISVNRRWKNYVHFNRNY